VSDEFRRIDAAFRAGDMDALRAALGDPDDFPNVPLPIASFGPAGECLEYAIYHSPLGFIAGLLEAGADPNPENHAGFPPLIAALSCTNPHAGTTPRSDVAAILQLLLGAGANPNQRGVNDWTALHMAVAERNTEAIRILLDAGADPLVRTRIDECETPRQAAERAGLGEIANVLAEAEAKAS
jgi:ankyrin repeat protein